MEWLRTQKGVYFGNAGAVKDYRVQLRGNKAIWFWLGYLLLLTFFAMINYSSADIGGARSVAAIQDTLHGFYMIVLQTVQTVVLLVAPVLASQGIVNEYERQSYDLVITAPVTPKYFLVGKLISGARTLVLLLVLSLPVASLGVIMGGATWGDVFNAYAYLLLQGILVMGLSLPMAMMTKKMPTTVFYMYGLIGFMGIFSGITFGMASFGGMMGSAVELPFYSGLLPYLPAIFPSSATLVGRFEVPNLVLAVLLCGLLVKLCLVGAGSVMTRTRSAETVSFRVHGLALAGALGLLAFFMIPPDLIAGLGGSHFMRPTTISPFGAGSGGPEFAMGLVGMVIVMLMIPVAPFVPHLAAYCYGDGRKHEATGWFQPRRIFDGAPGGGLPYLLALMLVLIGPVVVLFVLSKVPLDLSLAGFGWALSFTLFCWAIGWAISGMSKTISGARRGTFGVILAACVIPVVLLGFLQSMTLLINPNPGQAWAEFSPFHPFGSNSLTVFLKVPILVALGAMIGYWAEGRRIKKAQQAGVIS